MTVEEIHNRVVATASVLFRTDLSTINAESSIEQIPTWDSVAHLNFILALEQEFQCGFNDAEIESLISISSIVQVISSKQ